MTLEPHAVDFDSIRLDEFDDLPGSFRFRTVIFKIVVVVVELRIWIDFGRNTECDWDEGLSDNVVENAVSITPVFFKRYISSILISNFFIYQRHPNPPPPNRI